MESRRILTHPKNGVSLSSPKKLQRYSCDTANSNLIRLVHS